MTATTGPDVTVPRRRPLWRSLLLPWLLLAVVTSIWALATPPGGSPDEPAHMVKAASVARGELTPSAMIEKGGVLQVPAWVAFEYEQTCYAFFATQPVDCIPQFSGDPAAMVSSYSSASLYDPVYYALVGWPSLLFQDESGLYAMRIVSGILCSFLVALSIHLVGGWRRGRLPATAVLVALTPMAVFIMASVNPNALEFTGALAAFTALLSIVLSPDESRLRGRVAVVAVATALVVHARSISPLWMAVLLLAPLLLLGWRDLLALLRRRSVIVAAAVIVVATLLSVWWTLTSNSLGTAPTTGPDVAPPAKGVGTPFLQGFLQSIGDFYTQIRQMIGVLGWLDTIFNPLVYIAFYAMIGLLAVGVLIWVRGRRLVFAAVLAAAFFFLPPFVQALYITRGGYIWQGRYSLVLLMCLIVGAAAVIATSPRFLAWRRSGRATTIVVWAFAAIWTACSVWAFATAMRRNTVGYLGSWGEMLGSPGWAPPLGPVVLLTLFTVATAGLAASVVRSSDDELTRR
ncbi:DUF2142 domain-containing protein [Cnuibacter physcomitrellae]|uniref:DUF2142 domain-containing protein n=1 Tax=Cnuibacter physcomitrellae TaxID=1619308 RepID=UPI00217600BA|nr:DUF2142 domain-containing protein [Cnuibacter physcomitrellae]MCS5496262.1 DUF2142 domain-containing protein [Cnuibacter physcomitrellae]